MVKLVGQHYTNANVGDSANFGDNLHIGGTINASNASSNAMIPMIDKFKQLEMKINFLVRQLGMSIISSKDKENPMIMEIKNATLIDTYNEPKLDKFNNGDPINIMK